MSPDSPIALVGYAIAALTVLITAIRDRRKSDVDESSLILSKWKDLVDTHQADMRMMKEEFALYKTTAITEIADLRTRLVAAEKRITELETENAGLKRAIAQNSQSSAYIIGQAKGSQRLDDMQQQIDKLDRKDEK